MNSVWSSELQNLHNMLDLSKQHAAETTLPNLMQENFLAMQQHLLPNLHHIFTKYQHVHSTFPILAQKFPTAPVLITTWGEMERAITNLIAAIFLATPYYEALPKPKEPAPIEVIVGKHLLPLIQQPTLIPRMEEVRKKLVERFGFPFPKITFKDDQTFQPHHYQIVINGVAYKGTILATQQLAISTKGDFPTIQGIECTDPIFGLPAKWINSIFVDLARNQSCIVLSPIGVIIAHLERLLRQRYADFFTSKELATLIKQEHDLASVYLRLPKSALIQIFRTCVRSQIPLTSFSLMLSRLLELQNEAPEDMKENADYLYVQLRQYFPPEPLTQAFKEGKILCLAFSENASNQLLGSLEIEEELIYLPDAQVTVRTISENYLPIRAQSPFVLCPDFIIPALLRQFDRNDLSIPLVMQSEIPEHITIEYCAEDIIL